MILVVSEPGDDHAAAVADLLLQGGREVEHVAVPSLSADTVVGLELDGQALRRRLTVTGRRSPIDLGSATTGFWRRREAPVLSRDLAALAEIDGAPVESTAAFESVVASLGLRWINDPERDRASRRRPRQWTIAIACGLRVPATLVTRDPAEALAFRDARLRDGVVVKPLTHRVDDWTGCRIPTGDDDLARRVARADAETVVQRRLNGPDVRVLVVAGEHFAVEIEDGGPVSGAESLLEAVDAGDRVRPTLVPTAIGAAIDAMMARLGLITAAVDLRRDADGELHFIDLDPAPRWLLVEELTGWPVTEAVVEALAVRDGALTRP